MRHRPTPTAARCAAVVALLTTPLVLAAPASAAPADTAPAAAAAGPAGTAPQADFNHDGYADIVATAPGGTVDGTAKAGYITVVYGSASGAATGKHQVISRATAGVPGSPSENGRFGDRTVARDLDGDGTGDLVVTGGGAPVVLWGSTDGKGGAGSLQGVGGRNLTAGDFNGDGHADLVADGDGSEGSDSSGLHVMYGPFTRAGAPARTADIDTGHLFPTEELAAGDLNGDGRDDLVSMHAFEERSESSELWKGGSGGLATTSTELPDAASATVGDVDKDGFGDLIYRPVPGGVVEDLPYDKGTIKVAYGSANGPGTRSTTITQDSAGVPGAGEEGDQFGYSLSAGDVNGDGYADVAVGVPYEDLTSASGAALKDAGSTVLLKGGKGGLTGTGAQSWHQNTAGVPGVAEAGDRFGQAVSLLDTDGNGKADLAAGAPGEDGTSPKDTGAVWSLRGAAGGLTTDGVVSYGPGAIGAPEAGAGLGSDFAR
ncbi:FG-GAP and VCBS repeat-containing protein [Streptomyces ochraceiscleroticus]|uniref:FG-GAP and VCBS repeat-containing protein n=1 Tax=Streptomyces ochraceiscleroticus TaxID=47761 RepID=A0ABW1MGI5_9ACTN|nr:FG-GAP and VCBS repeat-containing protein [Streptomyces ochraceiscleroticus]